MSRSKGKLREQLKAAITVFNQGIATTKRLAKENTAERTEEFDEAVRQIVARFYASYEPKFYNRQRSLYTTFKVKPDYSQFDVDVEFEPGFMEGSHRTTNEYIFENTFVEGFHGGSRYGDDHPDPGTPYWRKPVPYYSEWSRPASQSFSPYQESMKRLQQIHVQMEQKYANEFQRKVLAPITRAINKLNIK